MSNEQTTTNYYTVTPLDENGIPMFEHTFRSTTRKDAMDNVRIFTPSYGEHGWTPVVKHTVHYIKGRRTWFSGKQFSIAEYAQTREKRKIADTVDPRDWIFVSRDNRFVRLSHFLARPVEAR